MQSKQIILLLFLWTAFACQKQFSVDEKLTQFSDNKYRYGVHYNGNTVTEITVDSGASAPFVIAKYSYYNGIIRADLDAATGYSHIDYFMKNASLPTRICKYRMNNTAEKLVQEVNFFYKAGTDQLDSVTLEGNMHYRFVPLYSGGNIADYSISSNYGPEIPSGSFLYYPIANVFKATNPLLFVYSSPVFEFETFLMPRIFSASTLKKFNGGTFIYDTDDKGKLSLEDYGPTYPYKRTYIYE